MNRKFILAIVLLSAGFMLEPFFSSAQQQRGQSIQPKAKQRTALVIGNSNYEQGPLRNPVNDARAVGNLLKNLGFDVTLLLDQNLQQMDEAVRTFGRKIKDGGIGLFYFAGHGLQVEGVNYLAPVSSHIEKEQDVKFQTLEIGKVTAEMEAAKNGLNIMILDACRNNPFTRSFRSPSPGLAPINAPSGTFIAFATAPGTTASDGDGANGLYTQELLLNLNQPGLRLEDIFIRTRVEVKKKSEDKQIPWENGALEGVVILNEQGTAATATTANSGLPDYRYSNFALSSLRTAKFETASVDEKGQVLKRAAGPVPFYQEELGKGVKLEMVLIRGGSFLMGSPDTEAEREQNEIQHPVRVGSFWMGRYEVTQAQWRAVMGRLPQPLVVSDGYPKGDDMPITCVRWQDVQEFITELNALLKLEPGKGYSLPREAEWEYAARGGTATPFPYGPIITPGLANYDWKTAYAGGPTLPRESDMYIKVGSFAANPFGLYDMVGNVSEWCDDWGGKYPTPRVGEQIDPKGPEQGDSKIVRGCDYSESATLCRSAKRSAIDINYRVICGSPGFRLVRRY